MSKRTNAEIDKLLGKGSRFIRTQEVVEFARSHPKSALHRALQWDDAKAAKAYRLIQANTLIVANLKFAHCS